MLKSTTKVLFSIAAALLLSAPAGHAKEGMWLPAKLKDQDSLLVKAGLKIPVSQLYNDSIPGLNNAVVVFGAGCTASFISGQGLLLTNHHCGYGYAQRLSTPEHNFLTDGFWALNRSQELPCPGLTITITRKMANVTDYILKGLPDSLTETKRDAIIEARMEEMSKAYNYLEKMDAYVKSFFGGNQYWVMVTQTYKDVRLVAFPPNGIGKFGADIDNWMWPRETGDFSMFRVYAGKDNRPAGYSPDNVPYRPAKFLKISTKGYDSGSFAMVYGFPYSTEEYLTSFELGRVSNIMYPIRVTLRGKKLAIWDEAMKADPNVFLKYAAKQASVSNGYKKWKGALQGLENNQVMRKKTAYEKLFSEMVAKDKSDTALKLLLPRMAAAVHGNEEALYASEYIQEAVFGIEIIREAGMLDRLLKLYRAGLGRDSMETAMAGLQKQTAAFYKDYVPELDQEVFEALMPVYLQQNPNIVAPGLKEQLYNAGNQIGLWSGSVYDNSVLARQDDLEGLLTRVNAEDTLTILKDPAYKIYAAVMAFEKSKVLPEMKAYENTMAPLKRQFIAAQLRLPHAPHAFYADANQTLRLSYGKVAPLALSNSDQYQTVLGDLIARHDPSVDELNVPKALRDLYLAKDYGRWAVNGKLPLNFLTTCQTTGGNSGSPVLNAYGQLIGLNFDRPWQGTMSDFYYSDRECRNISVDIRYVLFLVEKYGHAGWLLNEMKFVK
ncbi:MAG TPA: S46 family peptidase [Edaphocola sp.]|nr:S46 family peptidase [Edaphocola sp.]